MPGQMSSGGGLLGWQGAFDVKMNQILYILLGWTLGLFSPVIAEFLKSLFGKREFVSALKVELEDLQYRLMITSLTLLQSHGTLDKDFANWALKIIDRYSGFEPS